MNGGRLKIGDVVLQLRGSRWAEMMAMPGMEAFATDERPTVEIDVNPDQRHTTGDISRRCTLNRDDDGGYRLDIDGRATVSYNPRHPDRASILTTESQVVMRYALWSAYSFVGLRHGHLPVHASTIVWQGRGVMFLGESGTGKSTHSRLWTEHVEGSWLLNDDSPVLRIDDAGVWVYGSPWSGKTPCYRSEGVPVAAIVRLEQQRSNSIRRTTVAEAVATLHPSYPPWMAQDGGLNEQVVEYVCRVLEHVPVYKLGCLPDAEAAWLVKETVFAQ